MKMNQKTISIILAAISMVLILICIALPIFSFWNYRFCMIPFALISILLFLTSFKERTKKIRILLACIIFLLSAITFMLGLHMKGVIISAVFSFYIALLLLLPKTNRATFVITVISALIVILLQIHTIYDWFDLYNIVMSGKFPEVPLSVGEHMLTLGIDETGMGIIIICLIFSAFSVQCNIKRESDSIE